MIEKYYFSRLLICAILSALYLSHAEKAYWHIDLDIVDDEVLQTILLSNYIAILILTFNLINQLSNYITYVLFNSFPLFL